MIHAPMLSGVSRKSKSAQGGNGSIQSRENASAVPILSLTVSQSNEERFAAQVGGRSFVAK
jgi:hypothetical protein